MSAYESEDEEELRALPLARPELGALPEGGSRISSTTHELEGVGTITIVKQDMGRALFVWVSAGSRQLGDVVSAVPIPPSAVPTGQSGAASLLVAGGDGETREEAESFAAKLGTKLGRLVLLSWGVGPEHGMATADVQRLVLAACTQAS